MTIPPPACLLIALLATASASPEPALAQEPPGAEPTGVERAFEERGVVLDLEHGLVALDVDVLVRDDLLEYLLVNAHGAQHESLFLTEVKGSELNAALLLTGVERGRNATWSEKDPSPSEEELASGVSPWDVQPPAGDGFFLYIGWREGDEAYWYRVEDLLRNLVTGRSMQRHRWVYLGSRMVRDRREPEVEHFAADLEANLINVAYFSQGNTLLTGALVDCLQQTIWLPNAWLLPPTGERVRLVFARERWAAPPEGLGLPRVAAPASTPVDEPSTDAAPEAGAR